METEARSLGEPGTHLGMLVGGIIVDQEVEVEPGGHLAIDAAQEREELLMTLSPGTGARHLAGGHVEGGGHGRGPVTDVVTGVILDVRAVALVDAKWA